MNTGSQAIALGMIIMIMVLTMIVVFVVFGSEVIEIDCEKTIYSMELFKNISNMRNITSYCSNGGK